jgi:homoserine O-acetyltransferase/O-succinyltransferase
MNYKHFISEKTEFCLLPQRFYLELGEELTEIQIAYRTWGKLNAERNNAVLVCHSLTGWADVDKWWEPLLGADKALDPNRDFIICSNILGSCYGTTGPTSINPETGRAYAASFPSITIRDMVRLQNILIEVLGVETLQLVIGGSLGGMQVLEWALLYPEKVQAIAPIAVSGRHSSWCIGWSEAQRQAIYMDPQWQGGNYTVEKQPSQGLAVARMLAMNTYRTWKSSVERFGGMYHCELPNKQFEVINYLRYQGKRLVERFDANTYITLTHAMDCHDIAYHGQDYKSVLQGILQPSLILGIASDILYPSTEQQYLADLIPNAQLVWLESIHGHDAFLIEMDALNELICSFRNKLQTFKHSKFRAFDKQQYSLNSFNAI